MRTAICLLLALAWGVCSSAQTQKAAPKPSPPQTSEEVQRLLDAAEKLSPKDRPPKLADAYDAAVRLKDRVGEGRALHARGECRFELSQIKQALVDFEAALAIEREIGDSATEALSLSDIGLVYWSFGQNQKALEYYLRALPIERELGNRRAEAVTLSSIGAVYGSLGQLQKALETYAQALPIAKKVGDRQSEARILGNIGSAYWSLGRLQKSLEYYAQALHERREVGDRGGEASNLNNIGSVYWSLGRFQDSLDYYAKALPIWRELGNRAGEAVTLGAIGVSYRSLGQSQKALDYFAQALPIRREVGDRVGEAVTLTNIGSVYDLLGQKQEALDIYAESLSIERAVGDRGAEAKTLGHIGRALASIGLSRPAIVQLKLSVNVVQSLRKDIKELAKESQTSFVRQYADTYRELADLLVSQGRLAEAQEVLDLLKDEEYFRFLRRGPRSEIDLTPLEKTWADRSASLGDGLAKASFDLDVLSKRAKAGNLSASDTTELGKLQGQLASARKAFDSFLDEANAAFAKVPANQNRVTDLKTTKTLAGFIDRQPVATAGIYTLVTEDGVRTILTLPHVIELRQGPLGKIKLEDLYRKIAILRRALGDPRLDPVPLASDLFDIVVRPLLPELKAANVKRLMWSLDGPLRYLPLAALYDRVDKKYLIDEYPLHLFVPSDLLVAGGGATGVVGFGTTTERKIGNAFFPALPGVSDELKDLHDRLGARVYLDKQFTEDALKLALLTRPAVLHLATHFALRPGDGRNSFLLLGDGTPLPISDFAGWFQNSAHTDLLVLSACDTATPEGADADGGEYEGFARVAQDNGAAAVLATLWPVSDASTARLMRRFYELRKAHPEFGTLGALRAAQQWLMRAGPADLALSRNTRSALVSGAVGDNTVPTFKLDPAHPFAHPFYWAPFVLTGNAE